MVKFWVVDQGVGLRLAVHAVHCFEALLVSQNQATMDLIRSLQCQVVCHAELAAQDASSAGVALQLLQQACWGLGADLIALEESLLLCLVLCSTSCSRVRLVGQRNLQQQILHLRTAGCQL